MLFSQPLKVLKIKKNMYRDRYPNDPGMHHHPDLYTHRLYPGEPTVWERLRKSFLAIFVGGIMVVLSCCLLFYNEGRAVRVARALDIGLQNIISLPSEVINDYNTGKLVHITGKLKSTKVLSDPDYGIGLPVVRLKRCVEMYQWIEHETTDYLLIREIRQGDQIRDEKQYSYSKEWRNTAIDSHRFYITVGHQNPSSLPVKSFEMKESDVQLGMFYLSQDLIDKINNYKFFHVTHSSLTNFGGVVNNGYIYHSNDLTNLQVGDARIWYEYAGLTAESSLGPADVISVVAKQLPGSLGAMEMEEGDIIEWLYMGEYTAQQMFSKEHVQNVMLTWILRAAGWLLIFLGLTMMSQFILVLVDWLPVIRSVVALGMSSLNLCLSISMSLFVIAMGWVAYRPLLGTAILICSVAPFIYHKLKRSRLLHSN